MPIDQRASLSPWLTLLLAFACGLIVANIYYAQPLIGPISTELGMSPHAAGLVVTMTQLGYGLGLLFIVPLGDLIENRSLVLAIMAVGTLALLAAAFSADARQFLLAAAFIGLGSVAVQVLVPYAAHLAPEAERGRAVGNVMSGLMFGIMLSRPTASFIADWLSWHAVMFISAGLMVALGVVLRLALPRRHPPPGIGYAALLRSLWWLMRHMPVLRRRGLYHAGVFGAFSLFWTTAPLRLAGPFHLSQSGIALFALAGVAGGVSAPFAGRMADRGWGRRGRGVALAGVAASFALSHVGAGGTTLALGSLVASAILLDACMTAHLVFSQRDIFALGAEFRSRLNGLFMAIFFVGGAVGSATGGWAYAQGGWWLASAVGITLPAFALAYFATEPLRRAADAALWRPTKTLSAPHPAPAPNPR